MSSFADAGVLDALAGESSVTDDELGLELEELDRLSTVRLDTPTAGRS